MIFTPSIAGNKDCLVVLAGGASSGSNLEKIRKYIVQNDAWVLAANYDYGVPAKYTYFGDFLKFKEQIKNIKTDVIVSSVIFKNAKQIKRAIYQVKCKNEGTGIYASKRVTFDKDGFFPYHGIGTSGLACLAISMFFSPKQLLLVGFDGPSPDASVKIKYDGSSVKYGKPKKMKKEKTYFSKSLIPTLKERGIELFSFPDVKFYGFDKKSLGIKVI